MDASKELERVRYDVETYVEGVASAALRRIDRPTATEREQGITRHTIEMARVARKMNSLKTAITAMAVAAQEATLAVWNLWAAMNGDKRKDAPPHLPGGRQP